MIGELAAGAAAATGMSMLSGCFHPRVSLFGPSVWHGPRSRPTVAVSFDDGPHPDFTPRIARALEAAGVRATFFCVGAELEAHPAVARALLAAGHELANHTFRHDTRRDIMHAALLEADLRRAQAALTAVGAPPSALYRPAVGIRTPAVHRAARSLGLTVVTWADAARDGVWPLTRARALAMARRARPGDILVLHDGVRGGTSPAAREATVAHLPSLLAALRERGLQVGTVSSVLTA